VSWALAAWDHNSMKTKLYALNGSGIAEDDGHAWSWSALCPCCGRSSRSQTGDITAYLVSERRPVVRTDSGAVLVSSEIVAAARLAAIELRLRTATLFDQEQKLVGQWHQLRGTQVLSVHSAEREACGLTRHVRWNPLVVEIPALEADVLSLDVSESDVLVSERLLDLLRKWDSEVVGEPVEMV